MPNFTIELVLKASPELEALLRSLLGPVAVKEAVPVLRPSSVPESEIGMAPVKTPPAVSTVVPVTVPPAAPAPATVPTTDRVYTVDELARAAAALFDAGKMAETAALLPSFGIASIHDLKAEQYGAFATALRGLGANI